MEPDEVDAVEQQFREELAAIDDTPPMPESKLDLENPIHLTVRNRMLELETAMANKDPMIKLHLGEIHKHMIAHEEIVHLLSDSEIAAVMRAQQSHTNTTLVVEAKPKSKKTADKAAKLTKDDL